MINEMDRAASETDKGSTGHGFAEIYGRFFCDRKNDPLVILEIGIGNGGSLRMWEKYFPRAKVYGLDVAPAPRVRGKRIKCFVGDQVEREDLCRVAYAIDKPIDILIDDGSHRVADQQLTFGASFEFVRPGGYYIIEDIHTSLGNLVREGKGDNYFGVAPDESNSTLAMIERYFHGSPPRFKSPYMLPFEMTYLNLNVEFINVFYRNEGARCGMTAIIKKRLAPIAPPEEFRAW